MRVLSIWWFDPAAKQPPTPDQMQQMGTLIAELKSNGALIDTGGATDGSMELRCRFLDVSGDGTCELHEVSSA